MVLGRLFHYAVDAVLLSTVVAGVRRSSGLQCVTPLSHHVNARPNPCAFQQTSDRDYHRPHSPYIR